MNGAEFIASFIATGRLHGVGVGSSLAEVDRAFRADYIDDFDEESNLSLRRDYGLVEIYFNDGPEWVVVGASVEIHRLSVVDGLAKRWHDAQAVEFSEYLTWDEVAELIPAPVGLTVKSDQSDYLEYRAEATKVAALVVDNQEERDDWPGQGDVFSVSLG